MKSSSIAAAAALALALALHGAEARAKCPRPITTTVPFLNLPCPQDDPRWSEAFAHWDQRENKDEALAAVKLFEAILKDHPNQLEARLWVMRGYYGAGMKFSKEEQAAWMKKAAAAADKALELDPKNEQAKYWRWASMIFFHTWTDQDFAEIRTFGMSYEGLREVPVPGDDPLWAEAIKHWDARTTYEEGPKAIEIFSQLEKKYPDKIEPKLWLLRANYWMHFVEASEEGKAKWLKAAMEWGDKAIAMEPRNPAANYLTAASQGMYGSHTNFANYVRYSMSITEKLMLVMEEEPNYYYSGVSQYFCLAIARAPTIVPKMLDLMGYTEQMIESQTIFASHYEPRYLRNNLALAEMYLARGRKDEAKKLLVKVLAGDPNALKNMAPENQSAQDLAKKMMEKNFPGP
jgi:tetratricopeptide (TPR) repeat protein